MTPGEKICGVVDWGVVPYAQAVAWQEELVRLRKAGEIPDLLILCQHPPVITLGRNAGTENVLASDDFLQQRGIELHPCNRGGDVTFHGPGQLVGYPIFDLHNWKKDVGAYMRSLEDVLIRTVADFGIAAHRLEPEPASDTGKRRRLFTGVWATSGGREEKIAALGVHLSRWITSHGFALNVTTDLSYFGLIVPCGIEDKGAISIERLLPKPRPAEELMTTATNAVRKHFGEVFDCTMQPIETEQWEDWLGAQQATAS